MSESQLCTTSQWIKFFCNAGLPPNVAANYALIFSDNRIQQNMLMDLSKEYLYDMGIKVMGDVIAILRYSKEFHNQLAKEKIIGNSETSVPTVRNSSPVTRMLGRYTRPAAATSSPNAHIQPGGNMLQKVQPLPAVSRKRIHMTKEASASEETAAKKIRRVLPEEEGAYTIKMPSGTTERSRKIIEQQMMLTSKKSVFDRLGDSHVSSSTDVKKIIGSCSVFNRLGPSTGEVSTSTSVQSRDPPLTYRGVLKNKDSGKKMITATKRVQSVAGSGMTHTVPAVKLFGSKPTIQSKRRTVINNLAGTSGVSQINNILKQNAQFNVPTGHTIGSSHGILTTKSALFSKSSAARNRPGMRSAHLSLTAYAGNQVSKNKIISLKKNISPRLNVQQSSVFQRLGK